MIALKVNGKRVSVAAESDSVFRSGELEMLPNGPKQRRVGFGVHRHPPAVHAECNHGSQFPRRLSGIRPAYRYPNVRDSGLAPFLLIYLDRDGLV